MKNSSEGHSGLTLMEGQSFLDAIRAEMGAWKDQIYQTVQDLHQELAVQKQQACMPYTNQSPLMAQTQSGYHTQPPPVILSSQAQQLTH